MQDNHLPCKPGVVGLIPSFSSLSNETLSYGPISYDPSCWRDVKLKLTKLKIDYIFCRFFN